MMGKENTTDNLENKAETEVVDIHVQEIKRSFLDRFTAPIYSFIGIGFFVLEVFFLIVCIKSAFDRQISVEVSGLAILAWGMSIGGILYGVKDLKRRLERSKWTITCIVLNAILCLLTTVIYISGLF